MRMREEYISPLLCYQTQGGDFLLGMFIDFHTHILPGIDDGSRNEKMTLALLDEEKRQGAGIVVATPHFYADRDSIDRFLERREESFERTKDAIAESGITAPALMRGGEIYYFPGMSGAEKLPELCIKGTDVILIEMPFAQWTNTVADEIEKIITERKLRVVLAHVERYTGYQKDKGPWERVMDMPLVTQINAGSFLKDRRKRRFCLKWIQGREGCVIASDCHNLEKRSPNVAMAREVIEKKAGAAVLERMDGNAKELLGL